MHDSAHHDNADEGRDSQGDAGVDHLRCGVPLDIDAERNAEHPGQAGEGVQQCARRGDGDRRTASSQRVPAIAGLAAALHSSRSRPQAVHRCRASPVRARQPAPRECVDHAERQQEAQTPAITRASRSAPPAPALPLLHADAERAPLRDGCADLVISEYGAAIWCDPYRWILEAARLLRPGGRLVFIGGFTHLMLCLPEEGPAGDWVVRDLFGLHP
jgi:SAM-dependent methyltransferase